MGGIRREEKFFAVYGIPFFLSLCGPHYYSKKKIYISREQRIQGAHGIFGLRDFSVTNKLL